MSDFGSFESFDDNVVSIVTDDNHSHDRNDSCNEKEVMNPEIFKKTRHIGISDIVENLEIFEIPETLENLEIFGKSGDLGISDKL